MYLLYGSGRLIYIGVAVNGSGIRQEYELASDPLALYRRYLNAHKERYGGRLPPCNERELTAR